MSNMELEMKIKNVNEKELVKTIEKLGGTYLCTAKQFLIVYDVMYINQRYHADLYEYNNETIPLRKKINLEKIKNLFDEIDQLLTAKEIEFLQKTFNLNNLSTIFTRKTEEVENVLTNSTFIDFINKFNMSPNKWIRLRKTIEEYPNQERKELTTLTIKHILRNNETGIQQMKETEIIVNSMEETNELLTDLGFSYRSYQEKRRVKYKLNEHEIDIDTWPGLPTYFEVEGKNKEDLEKLLTALGYSFEEAVSCTVDVLYQEIGMDINNMKELKF